MLVNIEGRIENLPLPASKVLLPIFEGIINSLEAIDDVGRKSTDNPSFIRIRIERDRQQTSTDSETRSSDPIANVIIEDNGIGFTDANFYSFNTSDSLYKKDRGGKGIGRFLWLKAFSKVKIESVFDEFDGRFSRAFEFTPKENGVEGGEEKTKSTEKRFTRISLIGLKDFYYDESKKRLSKISARIIEHCLSHFIGDSCPLIFLSDGDQTINLNEEFTKYQKENSKRVKFKIGDKDFDILHLRLYKTEETSHSLHFCANNREVSNIGLTKLIPNLSKKLHDEAGNTFTYVGYIFSTYLDSIVNSQRTAFHYPAEESESLLDLKETDVKLATANQVKVCLEPFLKSINDEKIKKIKQLVHEKAPQFRSIIAYKEKALERLSPDLSETNLELELYKLKKELEVEVKEEGCKFIKTDFASITNMQEYRDNYAKMVQKINDMGKDELSHYILHRKMILDLLARTMELRSDDQYHLEDQIHQIMFPRWTKSDNVMEYEDQNLWLIDERLAFHYYLASEATLSTTDPIDSADRSRADLLIFQSPCAFVNEEKPFNSITIVEFKRPGRDDYKDGDNPIDQILNYIEEIRNSGRADIKGRPITVTANTQFYGYAICDLTDSLKKIASKRGFRLTPDSLGFIFFNDNNNAIIEVISFDKLLIDSKKRNRVLFEKLGLPTI